MKYIYMFVPVIQNTREDERSLGTPSILDTQMDLEDSKAMTRSRMGAKSAMMKGKWKTKFARGPVSQSLSVLLVFFFSAPSPLYLEEAREGGRDKNGSERARDKGRERRARERYGGEIEIEK